MSSWGKGSLAPVLKRFRVEGRVRGSEGTEFLWDLKVKWESPCLESSSGALECDSVIEPLPSTQEIQV